MEAYTFADAQEAMSCSLVYELYENVDGADLACCAFGRGICSAMWRDVSQVYTHKSFMYAPELPMTSECMSIGCC